MKALFITAPGEIVLREKLQPNPLPGEVLLKIARAGYCGSDLSTFRGINPLVSYPRIPGHELSGTIVEVADGVPAEWSIGTEVLVMPYSNCGRCSACQQGRANCCRNNQTLGVQRDGGLCEYLTVPWQKLMKAEGLSLAELAFVEPLTVGFHAVDRGRVRQSDTVVVLGCGAIGLGAIAGAAARGARVVAADLDDQKLELARLSGASVTINSGQASLHEELQALTGGEGPEVIIEAIGSAATFQAAVKESCFAGRVVYIGYTKAPVEYETKAFVQKELDIMGSRNAGVTDFKNVIELLRSGNFPVTRSITKTVPLSAAPDAMREWDKFPLQFTKIQISF